MRILPDPILFGAAVQCHSRSQNGLDKLENWSHGTGNCRAEQDRTDPFLNATPCCPATQKNRSRSFHPGCGCFSSIEAEFDSASDRTAKTSPLRLIPGGFAAAAREQSREHSVINIFHHDTDVTVNIAVDQHAILMI